MNKKSTIKSSAVKGIAWLSISAVILKIIGLIYKVPISYILGDEGMGYFNSAYTVYTLFYIVCSSGIPKGISIIVSKYEAENSKSGDSFYKSSLLILGFFGTLIAIFFILFAPFFTKLIGSSKALLSMYAVAPSVLFVCMNGVARGYLTGRMKFSHIAISEIIIGVSKLIIGLLLSYVGIRLSLDIHAVCALSILGITAGTLLSTLYLVSVSSSHTRGAPAKINRHELCDLIKISLPITAASLGGGLMGVIDLLLIMRGLSSSGYSEGVANALYGNYSTLTLPMVSLVSTLITPVITAYVPILSRMFAKGKMDEYRQELTESLSIVSFITIPCFFVYLIYPSELLGIIFESSSVKLGFMMLCIISPSILFLGATTAINNAMEATGKVKIPVLSISLGALSKILSTWILIKFSDLGILCAPLGTIISYLVSFLVSYIGIKGLAGGRPHVFKSAYLPFVASSVSLLVSAVIRPLTGALTSSVIQPIIILSMFGLVYITLMLILSKKSRENLLKIFKVNKRI